MSLTVIPLFFYRFVEHGQCTRIIGIDQQSACSAGEEVRIGISVFQFHLPSPANPELSAPDYITIRYLREERLGFDFVLIS